MGNGRYYSKPPVEECSGIAVELVKDAAWVGGKPRNLTCLQEQSEKPWEVSLCGLTRANVAGPSVNAPSTPTPLPPSHPNPTTQQSPLLTILSGKVDATAVIVFNVRVQKYRVLLPFPFETVCSIFYQNHVTFLSSIPSLNCRKIQRISDLRLSVFSLKQQVKICSSLSRCKRKIHEAAFTLVR